eukprot:PhF_6_TR23968/c2_g1_i1/m.33558
MVTAPDVVLTTQIISNAQCVPYDVELNNEPGGSRRPWLSLSRIITPTSTVGEDAWEFMMVSVTVAVVYITHFIIVMIVSRIFHSKYNWTEVVRKCRYPALSIRFQVCVLIPLLASGAAAIRSINNGIITLVGVVGNVMFFAAIVVLTYTPSTFHFSPCTTSTARYLISVGKWSPKTLVCMGGPFFRSIHINSWLSLDTSELVLVA